jgi:hypothetical protein
MDVLQLLCAAVSACIKPTPEGLSLIIVILVSKRSLVTWPITPDQATYNCFSAAVAAVALCCAAGDWPQPHVLGFHP